MMKKSRRMQGTVTPAKKNGKVMQYAVEPAYLREPHQ